MILNRGRKGEGVIISGESCSVLQTADGRAAARDLSENNFIFFFLLVFSSRFHPYTVWGGRGNLITRTLYWVNRTK